MIQSAYYQFPARKLSFSGEITYLTGASLPFSGEQALSFSISEGAGEGMLLGGAFSASFSLSLHDWEGVFTFPHSPKGAQIRLFLEGNGERSPLGIFTVSKVFRDEHTGRLTLSGMDGLGTAFESPFSDSFSYPVSLKELARGIASQAGFSLAGEVPNGDILISSPPAWGDISLRRAMGYAAEAAGCFAAISREGALRFFPAWPQGVSYEIAAETVMKREYGETVFGPLEGLRIHMHQARRDASPLVVSGGNALLNEQNSFTLSGNPLFSENSAHTLPLAQGLLNHLQGMKLSQGKISWRGDPSLFLGDRVRVWDASGSSREMQVTGQTLSFSRGFFMQSDCRTKGKENSVGRLFTSSGALNAAMLSGEVNGALIRDGSIAARSLLAGSITSLQLAADSVTADQLAARSVTAQKLAARAVEAEHLSADALTAVNAQLKTAHIGWAEIDELTAAIAHIASGKIQNADIDFAHIKDLSADTAIITKGVGGELYISRLAVTEANMVSLSVGQLLVKGEDGGFYALSVDGSGNISTEKKQVGNDDVGNLSINAGEKLIEGSVTAATLNAKDIFADSAIIRQLIAANIDVDTLFAREATVAKLNAVDISGNEYLRLSVKKAVDDIKIGGRNLLKNSASRPILSGSDFSSASQRVEGMITTLLETKGNAYNWVESSLAKTPAEITESIGAEYSFSVDVKVTGNFSNLRAEFDVRAAGTNSLLLICPAYHDGTTYDQWIRLKGTGAVTGTDGASSLMCITWGGSTVGSTIEYRNFKVEVGNKATDWTAAPEDLETRVLNAETAITENADEIELRAKKTEVDSLTGRITDAEAQIVTQAGEIQMAVTEVSNISIGGTNILPGYAEDRTVYQFFSVPVADIFQGHEGEDVCISFECKATVARSLQLYPYQALGLSIADTFYFVPSATEFSRHTFVTKVKKWPDVTTGYVGNSIAIYDYAGGQNYTIRKFKIELGNKPTDWSPCPDDPVKTLKNTAMTLNADGIEMTTTGHFRLYANDGKNSRIKLGGDDETANFSVDETGKLGAVSGAFANGLTVGGQGVWTRGNIIISSSQPTGVHDVLWLQPLQGVEQVHHSFLNTSQGYWTHDENYNYTLTPQSSDVLTPGGSYTYSLTLQMAKGGSGKGIKSYTMQATLSTSAGSVTLTSPAFTLNDWGNAQVTLTATSATNLFAASGNVTAAISVKAPETGNTYLYVKNNTEITLTSKNTAASGAGARACTIHYIP